MIPAVTTNPGVAIMTELRSGPRSPDALCAAVGLAPPVLAQEVARLRRDGLVAVERAETGFVVSPVRRRRPTSPSGDEVDRLVEFVRHHRATTGTGPTWNEVYAAVYGITRTEGETCEVYESAILELVGLMSPVPAWVDELYARLDELDAEGQP